MFNIQAIESLAMASKKYEEALRIVSDASNQFAEALDTFARVKDLERPEDEEDDIVEGLRSLSGYQYYVGSQQRVLANLVNAQCTAPLQDQSAAYRKALIHEQKKFSTALTEKQAQLKKREKSHIAENRQKNRNLEVYRRGLEDLTAQLDELDHFKYEHYEMIAEFTRKVWGNVLDRATIAGRAQVDVFEKISDKGLQNDCLGRMIASSMDPFENKPVKIIDKIERVEVVEVVEVVERPGTPMSNQPWIIVHLDGSTFEVPHTTLLTAPAAFIKHIDQSDEIDDIPSAHPEEEEGGVSEQTIQLDVPPLPSEMPAIITPPLTPTKSDKDESDSGQKDGTGFLARLGGFGWRG